MSYDNIDLFEYSPKYSNIQNLLFTIENKNDNDTYNIMFSDGTIVKHRSKFEILNGTVCNINSKKRTSRNKTFYHEIYRKSLLYKSRIDFYNNDSGYYQKAVREKWIDEICESMIKLKNVWSKEDCHEKALLCKSRIEFQEKYKNFYQKAHSNNWLDDVCSHMIQKINQLESDRIIYAYIFDETKTIYIGLTKNFDNRHSSRLCKNNDCVMNYINEFNIKYEIKFLTDFMLADQAQIKEQEFIDDFKNKGWNVLNKYKAGSLGG